MATLELNIANALSTAKEVLVQMITQGFSETKYVFALSNMLVEKFNLTKDQSIIVIENAFKLV
jgi:tRNA U34 5-methylaminomethyl-2-thiouridine-forming methyltransferase MnmC